MSDPTTTHSQTTPTPTSTSVPISAPLPPSATMTSSHPLDPSAETTNSNSGSPGVGAGGGSNTTYQEPVPMVHVRALVISGQNHVFNFEPEVTVGRMKELVWSMWPSDWTEPSQPPSPSYLRILHAGRILQDDTTLVSNNLPVSTTATNPTVIHISVRSFSIRAEDDPKKGNNLHPTRTRSRAEEDVGGCKCVIM